jgi:hypothetical protein
MWPEDPARCGRKYETIPLGAYNYKCRAYQSNFSSQTLATDKGFKERVHEDMLVRLLDAFVWRNHGKIVLSLHKSRYPNISQIGKKNNNLTYVRSGDERSCRSILVYNAIRSRGVFLFFKIHRGVCPPVRSTNSRGGSQGSQGMICATCVILLPDAFLTLHSFLTGASRSSIRSYMGIYDLKTCLPRSTPFLVRFNF